jgi:hypothetical protein
VKAISDLNNYQRELILDKSGKDPVWWVQSILGDKPWKKQVEVLEAVRDHKEIACKSSHSTGKSWVATRAALWWLYNHCPSIVITTAPTDRQVRGVLWKEMNTAFRGAKIRLGGTMLTQELKLAPNWWAWGFTAPSYDPDRFQGFHEENVLVIIDEAAGVSAQINEAIDGILSGGNACKLMIGNPTDSSGAFGEAFRIPNVKHITISAYDTPNFTTFGITPGDIASGEWKEKITGPLPCPYLVTPEWVAERYKRWGPQSPMYIARVLGEFPSQSSDSLFPITWIEAARERTLKPETPITLGVDVARFGDDETCIYVRRGGWARRIHSALGSDTMTTAGYTIVAIRNEEAEAANVDGGGLGGGVVDRLNELGAPVNDVNFGSSPSDLDHFIDRRSEMYWALREHFEKGTIDIEPEDEELYAQLADMKWKMDSRGRIVVESKDAMRKRGSKSPDRVDALTLAFAPESSPVQLW